MNDAKLRLSAEEMRLVTDPGWILTKNSILSKVVALFAGLSGEWRAAWEGNVFPEVVYPTTQKIAKGENYKGLPYVMLDYPRIFGREDVLAIRTLFWWGHAFSVTLHLKGIYRELYLPVIRRKTRELAAAGFELGVSDDEWEHGHTPENYRPLGGVHLEEVHLDGKPLGDGDLGGKPLGDGDLGGKPLGDGDLGERPLGDASLGGKPLGDASLEGQPFEVGGLDEGLFNDRPFLKLSARCGLEHWEEAPERLSELFGTLLRLLADGPVGAA